MRDHVSIFLYSNRTPIGLAWHLAAAGLQVSIQVQHKYSEYKIDFQI